MPVSSAARHQGKLKRDIADEAFQKLGKDASVQQVDDYFRKHYGLPHCERSMFARAKRKAHGKPPTLPRRYRRNKEEGVDIVDVVKTTIQMAHDLGGWDQLEQLIQILKGTAT